MPSEQRESDALSDIVEVLDKRVENQSVMENSMKASEGIGYICNSITKRKC